MPSHAAGDSPVYALKEIVVAPGNSASGLDPHQGAVLLHDGVTGQLIAILNASPITEIRTAAVSAVATKLLARPGSRTVAILGSGVQGRSHVDAMQTVLDDPIIRIWSRERRPRRGARARDALARRRVDRGGARRRGHRLHRDVDERAPRRARVARAGHAHQRRRGVPDGKSRELSTATVAAARFFVDRRESTLNEAGDYRVAAAESGFGPEHIIGELGEVLDGTRPGPALGRRADGVQVDGHRRRGSRRGAARASPGRASAASASRSTSDPARRDRGCPRAYRRRRDAHAAHPAAGAEVSGRDLAQARVPAADRLVQDPRRRQRHPLGARRRRWTAAC